MLIEAITKLKLCKKFICLKTFDSTLVFQKQKNLFIEKYYKYILYVLFTHTRMILKFCETCVFAHHDASRPFVRTEKIIISHLFAIDLILISHYSIPNSVP